MKAPTCRLCGAAHWPSAPHAWGDDPKPARATTAAKPAQPKPSQTAPPAAPRARFDRNAYQREYMRKWRARHKPKPT